MRRTEKTGERRRVPGFRKVQNVGSVGRHTRRAARRPVGGGPLRLPASLRPGVSTARAPTPGGRDAPEAGRGTVGHDPVRGCVRPAARPTGPVRPAVRAPVLSSPETPGVRLAGAIARLLSTP